MCVCVDVLRPLCVYVCMCVCVYVCMCVCVYVSMRRTYLWGGLRRLLESPSPMSYVIRRGEKDNTIEIDIYISIKRQ
jgi:hypothetical protein